MKQAIDWILTGIGRGVVAVGDVVFWVWRTLIVRSVRFITLPLWRSMTSTKGKVRWIVAAVVLASLWAAVYNSPAPYNTAVSAINGQLDRAQNAVSLPSWLTWASPVFSTRLPVAENTPYRLGLDLVGGTQLLYSADVSKLPAEDQGSAVEGVRDVIERRVNAFGVAEPIVQTDQSNGEWRVLVELAGVDDVNEAIRQIGETPLLEFKEQDPTANQEPTLTPEQEKQLAADNAKAKSTAESVLRRARASEDFAKLANEFSEDPGSQTSGGDLGWAKKGTFVPEFDTALFETLKVNEITRTLVQTDFGYHIIQKLEERGAGDEREVRSRHILIRTKTARDLVPQTSDGWLNTQLSGKQLARAQVVFDPQTQQPQVQLTFNDEGGKLFEEITGRNVGKPVGIFLDGQVISAPNVSEAISGGSAVISGQFTVQDAKLLAQRLNAGALPVPITLLSQQRVGATLGDVAVERSLIAGLYGFLLVAIFMLLYYRLPGLVSVIALCIYVSLLLAIFKLGGVTLTLAGIAGFILSMGMAVDANILIFERLREEMARGRSLPLAIEEGFHRAWSSIFDSNVSSLLTCTILWWFGTSIVRGFALTLGLGILVSMFSAVWVTRSLLRLIIMDKDTTRPWLYSRVTTHRS